MDIGFVNSNIISKTTDEEDGRYHSSHILVPEELKSNWEADKASIV